VRKIEYARNYIRIIGVTLYSNDHVDSLMSREEFEKLTVEVTSLAGLK